MFDNEWVIDYSASEKITLSGIWLLENGQLLELLNLGENTMKKLEIKKTEARKIHIKKVLLDSNFRIMNIISLVAFIAMVYGIIRNQNVTSDDTLAFASNLDYIIIPLLIWFVFTLIVYFTSGAHVSDMFSEVLEVNDEAFVHSKNEAKGGGYMADIEGNVRVYDIVKFADIQSCKYDNVTKRIEIIAPELEVKKIGDSIIGQEYVELNKFIFYDYYEPNFLEELKAKNISITEERIKYRINEMPDEYRGFGGDKRFIEDAKKVLKQGSRIIIFIALVVVLGSVGCFLYYTIRFNVRRTDALNQTQEIADELYPMIVERDFDGMTKYFAKVDGTPATTDEVEQYVTSMDEGSFFENYTEEDQPMFHVYGDTNYRQMIIEIWDVDEESKTHTLTFYLYKIDKLWKIVLEE